MWTCDGSARWIRNCPDRELNPFYRIAGNDLLGTSLYAISGISKIGGR